MNTWICSWVEGGKLLLPKEVEAKDQYNARKLYIETYLVPIYPNLAVCRVADLVGKIQVRSTTDLRKKPLVDTKKLVKILEKAQGV